nr:MAG TPA: hypothetical protein [Caudoviricetes sp.]
MYDVLIIKLPYIQGIKHLYIDYNTRYKELR